MRRLSWRWASLPLGVIGNTPDSGSGESWFDPRRGNSKAARRLPAAFFIAPPALPRLLSWRLADASRSIPGGATRSAMHDNAVPRFALSYRLLRFLLPE